MASLNLQSFFVLLLLSLVAYSTCAQLTPDFYEKVCPQALPIIRSVVQRAIHRERRMGASLLRLHFHDCFVNGCDGSLLLDDTPAFIGEKTAFPNINSVRGFEVVDRIKAAVDKACKRPVVSCADILAIAARDSVSILGGPLFHYPVLLGRRDARMASRDAANTNLPPPFFNFSQLVANFQSHGLNLKDLVVLSGGHTIGQARCTTFRDRLYSDSNIDHSFRASLTYTCPRIGGDDNLAPLDFTPARVDTNYYSALIKKKGLLHSDQELFRGDGGKSDRLVKLYSQNVFAFARDFGVSMVKMGNMKPLTGYEGEIRVNCRKIN
ncbi:cationic peroxidase 1-like [Prosopis cineraria]|uniref:cationic peroxidase 1-like n=1 Tax=Prosopis cineraria TaxID=364024 RepID=UPI0024108114|nr:cationic peroxidase 1-like [Prosopis cineraria]